MKPALRRVGYWTAVVFVLYLAEIFVAQRGVELLDTFIGFVTLGIWLVFFWVTKGPWRLVQAGVFMLLSGASMLIAYLFSYVIFEDPLTRIDESALLVAGPLGVLFVVLGLVARGIASVAEGVRAKRGQL